MTEEEARARIESMTAKVHEELVRACEQAWKGTLGHGVQS